MITPHGGKLVNKVLGPQESGLVLENINTLQALTLDQEQVKDAKNIGRGLFSPLEGFLRAAEFNRVVTDMRLTSGVVWSIPIVLDITKYDFQRIKNERHVLLIDFARRPIAILKDIEIYPYDKEFFAKNVFGTQDKAHPGVEDVYNMGDYLVGGEIGLLDNSRDVFPEHNFFPEETRAIFERRGWNTVAAFQTRNIPHQAHEFLQKRALEVTDGLFIQPVIGEKKLEDFKDEYILTSYEILIDKYYPKEKVVLGILPLKMRYAGPREAVLHAIIRKNFGCTHFIVGRDHAGAGDYYPPFAAQEIFDRFSKEEIGIEILKFPEVVYSRSKERLVFLEGTGENQEDVISFSGTKLREQLKSREQPPLYLIRPDVFHLIAQSYNSLVDNMYKKERKKEGFVLWFTGLPESGKTTLGNEIYEALQQRGLRLERLDGDIVRRSLSKGLGFTEEDRGENIKRVTFVARLLSRNGVGVVCSFISPYKEIRERARQEVLNFVEIYTNAPLEVCEARDKRGLYAKARTGEIQNFTGISDPYEAPENPEIELDTANETKEANVKKVLDYLEANGYI